MSVDRWISVPTVSGHYGPVQDISWEPTRGAYLLSVSSDQTTRAYAPCLEEEGEKESRDTRWCEIARPQIHGYDMLCVCTLNPIVFVSAADEKVKYRLREIVDLDTLIRSYSPGLSSLAH